MDLSFGMVCGSWKGPNYHVALKRSWCCVHEHRYVWSLTVLSRGLWLCTTPVLAASGATVQCCSRHPIINGQVLMGEVFSTVNLLRPLIHCNWNVLLSSPKDTWCWRLPDGSTVWLRSWLNDGFNSSHKGRKVIRPHVWSVTWRGVNIWDVTVNTYLPYNRIA